MPDSRFYCRECGQIFYDCSCENDLTSNLDYLEEDFDENPAHLLYELENFVKD
tara:strand:+ start:69 stop:227 length:159 start_codon:yes stop_codon:yes gene_type:complete